MKRRNSAQNALGGVRLVDAGTAEAYHCRALKKKGLFVRLTMLKSKIHRATVTGASLDYEGSIALPPSLMERSGLREFEKVLVADVNNGGRFETYAIAGREGEVVLNGAAARLGAPGDKVIIMAWAELEEAELAGFRPRVTHADAHNRPRD